MIKRVVWEAMGTEIELSVPSTHISWSTVVQKQFHQYELIFSRFIKDSELMRINSTLSTWQTVSPTLWNVLFLADQAYHQTKGLFSPYLLDAIQYHGYDQSFNHISGTRRDDPSRQHDKAIASIRQYARDHVVSSQDLPILSDHSISDSPRSHPSIEPSSTTPADPPLQFSLRPLAIKKKRDITIDLGGIAKGWAVQRIANTLKIKGVPYGSLNAGGDLIVWNEKGGEPWVVEIEDPRIYLDTRLSAQMCSPLLTFSIHQGAVATSGTAKRRWIHQDTIKHHLIDPRTRMPSNTDVLQATIVGSSLVEAEVLAKISVILGQQAGEAFLKDYARRHARHLRWWLVTTTEEKD
ncbi:MAG: FAD:protein FMN transferase [Candidatus Carbobacillus sp.]|nr:FAD:protein FMN transferase [Candidatus Carbobacillus sp.]